MTNKELTVTNELSQIERVLVQGDLSQLSTDQRVTYYQSVCKSMGLNPLTRPFDYITLNGKLTLYAKKDAADQLRKINSISIGKPEISFQDDLIIVTVSGHDSNGREDSEIGVVKKSDMRGDTANALMKAVTKAKRRLTLSICGLGWLDETEVETIPDARPVVMEDLAPASKPTTNGNGKHAELVARYNTLSERATALGIHHEPAEVFSTDKDLTDAGLALKAAVKAHEAQEEPL